MTFINGSAPWLKSYILATLTSSDYSLTGHYAQVIKAVNARRELVLYDGQYSIHAVLSPSAASLLDDDQDGTGITTKNLLGYVLAPQSATVLPDKSSVQPRTILLLRDVGVFPDSCKQRPASAPHFVDIDPDVVNALRTQDGREMAQYPTASTLCRALREPTCNTTLPIDYHLFDKLLDDPSYPPPDLDNPHPPPPELPPPLLTPTPPPELALMPPISNLHPTISPPTNQQPQALHTTFLNENSSTDSEETTNKPKNELQDNEQSKHANNASHHCDKDILTSTSKRLSQPDSMLPIIRGSLSSSYSDEDGQSFPQTQHFAIDDFLDDDSKADVNKQNDIKNSSSKIGHSKDGNRKDGDSKYGDSKDGDSKNGDSRDRDSRDRDNKDGDSRVGDSKNGDSRVGDSKNGDSKNGDSKNGDSRVGDSKNGDSRVGDSKNGDSRVGDSNNGDSRVGDEGEGSTKTRDNNDLKLGNTPSQACKLAHNDVALKSNEMRANVEHGKKDAKLTASRMMEAPDNPGKNDSSHINAKHVTRGGIDFLGPSRQGADGRGGNGDDSIERHRVDKCCRAECNCKKSAEGTVLNRNSVKNNESKSNEISNWPSHILKKSSLQLLVEYMRETGYSFDLPPPPISELLKNRPPPSSHKHKLIKRIPSNKHSALLPQDMTLKNMSDGTLKKVAEISVEKSAHVDTVAAVDETELSQALADKSSPRSGKNVVPQKVMRATDLTNKSSPSSKKDGTPLTRARALEVVTDSVRPRGRSKLVDDSQTKRSDLDDEGDVKMVDIDADRSREETPNVVLIEDGQNQKSRADAGAQEFTALEDSEEDIQKEVEKTNFRNNENTDSQENPPSSNNKTTLLYDENDPETKAIQHKIRLEMQTIRRVRNAIDQDPVPFILNPEAFLPSKRKETSVLPDDNEKQSLVGDPRNQELEITMREDIAQKIPESAPL